MRSQNVPTVSERPFELLSERIVRAGSSSTCTTWSWRTTPAKTGLFGMPNRATALPAPGISTRTRSGLASRLQPGMPAGWISDSGVPGEEKPTTLKDTALAARPAAVAAKVLPVQGRPWAVNITGPAGPLQELPKEV